MSNAARIQLPVRLQFDATARDGVAIRTTGIDAGWTVMACDSIEHAREIMARYPAAAMPCWRNPSAVWNR